MFRDAYQSLTPQVKGWIASNVDVVLVLHGVKVNVKIEESISLFFLNIRRMRVRPDSGSTSRSQCSVSSPISILHPPPLLLPLLPPGQLQTPHHYPSHNPPHLYNSIDDCHYHHRVLPFHPVPSTTDDARTRAC